MDRTKMTDETTLWVKVGDEMLFVGRHSRMVEVDLKRGEAWVRATFPDGLLELAENWKKLNAWCLTYRDCGRADDWEVNEPLLWLRDAYVSEARMESPQADYSEEADRLTVDLVVRGELTVTDKGRSFRFRERGDVVVVEQLDTKGG